MGQWASALIWPSAAHFISVAIIISTSHYGIDIDGDLGERYGLPTAALSCMPAGTMVTVT
jgi:hypothetical protein